MRPRWGRAASAGLACLTVLLLLGSLGGGAATPVRAPSAGTPLTRGVFSYSITNGTWGCSHTLFSQIPTFNPVSGHGSFEVAVGASSCGGPNGSISQTVTQMGIVYPLNSSQLPGIFRVEVSISSNAGWNVSPGLCNATGGASGACVVEASFADFGSICIEDLTSGGCVFGGAPATWNGAPINGTQSLTTCTGGACSVVTLGAPLRGSFQSVSELTLYVTWLKVKHAQPGHHYGLLLAVGTEVSARISSTLPVTGATGHS